MAYPINIIRRAEQILGYGITDVAGVREYSVVDGVIYTDLFDGDVDVEIPNYTGSFKKAFNGKFNGLEYYNEIHLLSKCKFDTVELELNWGSKCFIKEIEDLLTWLQENTSTDILDSATVESKKIEDFNVRYKNTEEAEASIRDAINAVWGYYIRRPLIISVAREQKNGFRYF
jgi:hypothetical protein